MNIKLLTKQHLEFLSLKEATQACLSLHLSKCQIAGNHMSRLIYTFHKHFLYLPYTNTFYFYSPSSLQSFTSFMYSHSTHFTCAFNQHFHLLTINTLFPPHHLFHLNSLNISTGTHENMGPGWDRTRDLPYNIKRVYILLYIRKFSRSFVIKKPSRNGEITVSFTDKGKFCHSRMFNVANMSYNPIRENKILAKISEFTVF